MEPGTYIAVITLSYASACTAVKTFRKGLNYGKDAERLVLALEFERFRLQLWGENSGLTPQDGEEATLPERLQPICGVLKGQLDEIGQLMGNGNDLKSRYGLAPTEEPATNSDGIRGLVERMQQSIRKMKIASVDDAETVVPGATEVTDLEGDEIAQVTIRRRVGTFSRFRWAVKDVGKFEHLVSALARMITKLNELLTESQQRKTTEDTNRINMIVVGSAIDDASLQLIRAAVRSDPDTSSLRSGIERRALLGEQSSSEVIAAMMHVEPLSLSMFNLPDDFPTATRFIAQKTTQSDDRTDNIPLLDWYLFERKDFDPNISPEDKQKLSSRMQRLVMLLRKPRSPAFMTPQAEGCIHDASSSCWWLVLHFPLELRLSLHYQLPSSTHLTPVSLLSLLRAKTAPKPQLEARIALASAICTTFSELYTSGWLHKGVRSDNILFRTSSLNPLLPSTTEDQSSLPQQDSSSHMARLLQSFLVAGFDYSRQESEGATIDKAKTSGNVAVAIYRHPNYQGDAAQGYKVQHDMYSLGLVLVEIALWMPISSFLDAKPAAAASICSSCGKRGRGTTSVRAGGQADGSSSSAIILSSGMEIFHEPHAVELKRRVLSRADSELGFRVGSKYYGAVKFCLEMDDGQLGAAGAAAEEDGLAIPFHPAMEFYNNVVVPLASASHGSL
ncbi:prion-inhibition and propagation-domain-containing protein [Lasiosphaeria ovina]|uniref:Prion-inhibition and propagation-domain-containing protein n=1 Tax=Lasiosphaeria ovina TaxID=92902 RepID=A0AAE0NJG4_9PEZI|nr:prion-inhibition and propagation-domain-containing protein [Lasiosphaeria ovina]